MTIRVVLVDDHRLFRAGLRALLERWGFQVVGEADDGAAARDLVRQTRPDVVLMDLRMPGLSGLAATRLLKAEFPELPVVILTASEEEDDLFEAVKSGAQGYLLKSDPPETVATLVEAAARGEAALTPHLALRIPQELSQQTKTTPAPARSPARPAPAEDLVELLTAREREVLELLVQGATNKEIARRLVVSENTVKYHLKNILGKLHLQNRAQVVAYALKHGLVPPSS